MLNHVSPTRLAAVVPHRAPDLVGLLVVVLGPPLVVSTGHIRCTATDQPTVTNVMTEYI
jgi:hypothetical protein